MHPILKKIINEPLFFADLLGYDKVDHQYHEDWILELWRPGTSVIQAHRNSYKTTCVVISCLRGLFVKPETRIGIVRKSVEEASKIVSEMMQQYEKPVMRKLYRDIYGINEVRNLDKWSETKGFQLLTKHKVSKERSVEPAGVGKHKTGAHYDLIIADDIVTAEDRYSEAIREKTKLYTMELLNIINPDGIGIKYSGTPWHEDDAFSILPTPMKYPISLDFIKAMTPEYVAELKAQSTDSLWAVNYELKHRSDTEKIFVNPTYAPYPLRSEVIGYLDPAFSDKKENDCTALTCGYLFNVDVEGKQVKEIKVKRGMIWQKEIDEIYDLVEQAYYELGLSRIIVESNAAQIAVAKELKRRGKGRIKVGAIHQYKNKHFRIVHYARRWWPRMVFDENVDHEYMKQILKYSKDASKKDAPDSLAGLVQYLTSRKSRTRVKEVQIA